MAFKKQYLNGKTGTKYLSKIPLLIYKTGKLYENNKQQFFFISFNNNSCLNFNNENVKIPVEQPEYNC